MKKIEVKGKLSLNKKTITKLNNEEMDSLKGGRIRITSIGKFCTRLATGCGVSEGPVRSRGLFCNP